MIIIANNCVVNGIAELILLALFSTATTTTHIYWYLQVICKLFEHFTKKKIKKNITTYKRIFI